MTVFLKCELRLGVKKRTDDHHLLLIVRRPKWNHDNPPQAAFILRWIGSDLRARVRRTIIGESEKMEDFYHKIIYLIVRDYY